MGPMDAPPALRRTPPGTIPVLIVICVAALGCRVWIGWQLGFLSDLNCFQIWACEPGEFIPPTPNYKYPVQNYPPMYLSILKLLRWGHDAFGLPGDFRQSIMFSERVHEVRPIILLLKVPSMVADIISAWIIFALGRHLGRPWQGVGLATFYVFSPVILYDGAYYGQTDTILLTFLLGAVYAYIRRSPFLLGAMMMAAPLMKAQAFFVLMILCVAILAQWREVWGRCVGRVIAGGLLSLAIVAGLAALTGQLAAFRDGYIGAVGWFPLVTSHAFNLWWLLLRPWDKSPHEQDFPLDTELVLGIVSYRTIGLVLFFAAMILILVLLDRRRYTPYALVLACAAAGWAFFNLPTEMHERYSVTAVGFMCLLPFWERRWYLFATLASITTTLNIVTLAPFFLGGFRRTTQIINWIIWPDQHGVWTVVAFLHVAMLPLILEALWRGPRLRTTPAFPIVEPTSASSETDLTPSR